MITVGVVTVYLNSGELMTNPVWLYALNIYLNC